MGTSTTASLPLFAPIDWLHEGERLGAAQIVLSGGTPYRDAYLVHGLFPDVIRPLLAFTLFGTTLGADRLLGFLLEPLAYVTAVAYVWAVFPTLFWRLTGLVGLILYPLLLEPRHIVVFLCLQSLTTWAYARRVRFLFISGLLAGGSTVLASIDHSLFLLITVSVMAGFIWSEPVWAGELVSKPTGTQSYAIGQQGSQATGALLLGTCIGLLPFLFYLLWTDTAWDFVDSFAKRLAMDMLVTQDERYPPPSVRNMFWYLTPATYALVISYAILGLRGSRHLQWSVIVPTTVFGIVSYTYALRQIIYWKLAVVSVPFVVGSIFLFFMLFGHFDAARQQRESSIAVRALPRFHWLTIALAGLLLVSALSWPWNPKQTLPRVLFPMVALLLILCAFYVGRRPRGVVMQRLKILLVLPLMAVLAMSWLYNTAKPQILMASLRKPKMIRDVSILLATILREERISERDFPLRVQDETVEYLRMLHQEHRTALVLSPGAGVYYFLADMPPIMRYPEIHHGQPRRQADEVIESLRRTHADLLVECTYDGKKLNRWWPLDSQLARYVQDAYSDSGKRLDSMMLGDGCPFSVWTHRMGDATAPAGLGRLSSR